jgi:hypothetical protein
MFPSNQFSNNGLASQTHQSENLVQASQPSDVLNAVSSLEALIPKNISGNKRAIIEKLIARYKLEALN